MIDWKRRALDLAGDILSLIQELPDYVAGNISNKAKDIIKAAENEDKVTTIFLEMWREEDPKKKEKLYNEYLELIRLKE